MQQLNYCRQMAKQFSSFVDIPNCPPKSKELFRHCLSLSSLSQKFMLPDGGHLLLDKEFRALDQSDKLRLPFSCIALEYQFQGDADKEMRSSKRIIFAVENEDGLFCVSVAYLDHIGVFQAYPPFGLAHADYLDRSIVVDGRPAVKIRCDDSNVVADLQYEAVVVLSFLNALSCSNVKTERMKSKDSGRKIKTAFPFDEYNMLTIDVSGKSQHSSVSGIGPGRSPREHLRRGHIRRYESGLKVWVNAAVVNPGVGGKITKDYRLAA